MKNLLSVSQAAKFLGVSGLVIERIIELGEVPSHDIHGERSFSEDDLAAYASSKKTTTPVAPRDVVLFSTAAAILGCSRMHVYRLVARGKLPLTHIGLRKAIARADVEAFKLRHEEEMGDDSWAVAYREKNRLADADLAKTSYTPITATIPSA